MGFSSHTTTKEVESAGRLELADASGGGALAGSLGTLAEHLGRLVAADSSTPLATLLVVLVGAENNKN